jgi:hypothetical protein
MVSSYSLLGSLAARRETFPIRDGEIECRGRCGGGLQKGETPLDFGKFFDGLIWWPRRLTPTKLRMELSVALSELHSYNTRRESGAHNYVSADDCLPPKI